MSKGERKSQGRDPNIRKRKTKPAETPEGRENQLIALAYDAAEERIRNGTASSAEIVHFLRLGSSKERLDQEDKRKDIELKTAKTEALESQKRIEELYSNALSAMRKYSGQEEVESEER
jgi:hypothetical protein